MKLNVKCKIVIFFAFLAGVDFQCSMGIKCIGNFRKTKKEIEQATCIVNVDFYRIIDNPNTDPSQWERTPSEVMNEKASSVILNYAKHFSKKRFRIDFKNVQFDINQQSVLNAMFSQLNTTDNIESYRVNDNVIAVIDSISSRCICHFPPIPMSEKPFLTIFCAS